MQKNKALKGLLAVSAAAAMFGAFGVHAQTTSSTQSAADLQKQTDQGAANMTGKTARDGTVNNTNSQGMEDRSGQVGSSTAGQSTAGSSAAGHSGQAGSTAGHSGKMDSSAGHSGSTAGSAGMSGSTGTGATGMSSQSSGQSGTAGATAGASAMSKADTKGIMDMAMVNMAEIEMGKLAQSKSQSPEVKTYAQQMIDDHTKGLQEVQTVAQAKGITLPTELDAKHKAMSNRLAKLSGEKFDREYMKVGGIASHKEAHALLQKNQKAAKDSDVKALATKMMPIVEQHLKSAQQMPAMKGSTSSGK